MRIFNPYSCPKCEHYEYHHDQAFGRVKTGAGRLLCKADKKPVELLLTDDPLSKPPARCPDYELEARKRSA